VCSINCFPSTHLMLDLLELDIDGTPRVTILCSPSYTKGFFMIKHKINVCFHLLSYIHIINFKWTQAQNKHNKFCIFHYWDQNLQCLFLKYNVLFPIIMMGDGWKHDQRNQVCQGKSHFPRIAHDMPFLCWFIVLNFVFWVLHLIL
jgi:hypothetical protein